MLARSLRFDTYPRDKTKLAAGPKEEKPLRGKLNHLPKWGRRKGRADTQEHLSPCPSDCWTSRAHWHGPAQIPVQSPLTPSSAAPGRSPQQPPALQAASPHTGLYSTPVPSLLYKKHFPSMGSQARTRRHCSRPANRAVPAPGALHRGDSGSRS